MPEIILIVEDSETQAAVLSNEIERAGYEAMHAPDAESALKMASEHKPDLVLLDVVLPDLDGFTVCRRLKSSPATKDVPVIMLTQMASPDDAVDGLNSGADDYLRKPISPRELRARIKNHLELRKWQRSKLEMSLLVTLRALATTVNHEINDPLQVILSNVEALQAENGKPDSEAGAALMNISRAVERISKLMGKIKTATSVATTDYLQGVLMLDVDACGGSEQESGG